MLKLMSSPLSQSLEFVVSLREVDRFAARSGDWNSLPSDGNFGRRSPYRGNPIHGMLDNRRAFLGAAQLLQKDDTSMKRNATAVDVARAIVFLASSLASLTPGTKIVVAGGNPPLASGGRGPGAAYGKGVQHR